MVKNRRQRITRDDVAALAGVSGASVSLVLNNVPKKTSAETRKKVLAAVKRLGYVPNNFARSLMSGRSYNIGIAYYDVEYILHSFFAKTIPGVVAVANENDYGIQFLSTREETGNKKNSFYFMDKVKSRQIDGIIFHDDYVSESLLKELSQMGLPYVMINRHISTPNTAMVLPNYQTTMQESIDYLASLGHQDIGFLVMNSGRSPGDVSRLVPPFENFAEHERRPGVKGRVIYLDIGNKPGPHGFYDRLDEDFLKHAVRAIGSALKKTPETTAYICQHDGIARVAYEVFARLGLRIPQDLSLIGINNDPPCALLTPPLSTNEIPSEEISRRAAEMLFRKIRRREEASTGECEVVYLNTRLIIRGSCAKRRKSSRRVSVR